MKRRSIRNSTAMLAVFSLVAGQVAAQDANLPECGEELQFPCVVGEDNIVVDSAEALDALIAETPELGLGLQTGTEAEADVAAEVEAAEPDPVEPEVEAEVEAEAEAEVDAETAEPEVEPEPVEESDIEPEAEAEAEIEAETETEAAPVEETVEATEESADATEEAMDEAAEAAEDVVEETEGTAEEAPMTEEELAEELADDAEVSEEAETGATDGSEEAVVETEAEAETEVEAEAETENEAESDIAEDTSAETDAAEAGDGDQMQDDGDTSANVETPPAAAAAEEGAEGEEAAEVTTEEVTEEDARSSDEDFETSATGDEASSDDDGGLSNFEKALLLGLGAVAVGSILDNGDEVVSNSGDRVVVNRDGQLRVLKDDDVLLRQPGSEVRTETYSDGSTRTIVTRPDGTQIVTIRAADGTVLRRARVLEDGSQVILFDDTVEAEPVDIASLPEPTPAETGASMADADQAELRAALTAALRDDLDRRFTLAQVRDIQEVRAFAPEVELDAITFATGSAAIQPSQAEELSALGLAIADVIEDDPRAIFLIEGHTDAVGDAGYNLALSDRRAETVALALTEYFDVPPENLVTQGYGESQLKVPTDGPERLNRRAVVRNITELLR